MAHPHALVNGQKCGGNSLARNADHRFTASSLQTDLSSAVVELHDSRASVCAGVVEQGAVSVERETDLIAGIQAENIIGVEQARFDRHCLALPRCFFQPEARRLLPLLNLVLKTDFIGDIRAALASSHAQMVFTGSELHRPPQTGGGKILTAAFLRAARCAVEKQLGSF